MKVFTIFVVIFAVLATAFALKDPVCGQEHAKDGIDNKVCMANFPSWSYKADTNECLYFVYGGCGGNDNRFESQNECEQRCLL